MDQLTTSERRGYRCRVAELAPADRSYPRSLAGLLQLRTPTPAAIAPATAYPPRSSTPTDPTCDFLGCVGCQRHSNGYQMHECAMVRGYDCRQRLTALRMKRSPIVNGLAEHLADQLGLSDFRFYFLEKRADSRRRPTRTEKTPEVMD